jgi:hypothetical protein
MIRDYRELRRGVEWGFVRCEYRQRRSATNAQIASTIPKGHAPDRKA